MLGLILYVAMRTTLECVAAASHLEIEVSATQALRPPVLHRGALGALSAKQQD